MKKNLIITLVLAALLAMGGPAMAAGVFDIDATAYQGGIDADFEGMPNGFAAGIGIAGGFADVDADGFVFNGTVGGNVGAVAGGVTATTAYDFNPALGDLSIGVGSVTNTYAVAETHIDLAVDPTFFSAGAADGDSFAALGQGSANISLTEESPIFFDSDGYSGGFAAQGSFGAFGTEAEVGSLLFGQHATAEVDAEMSMAGQTQTESYRFVDWTPTQKTEGMGSNVSASTIVASDVSGSTHDHFFSFADVDAGGGYNAAGIAATRTTQNLNGGNATAVATGAYSGSGALGSGYSGSAVGYSNTTATRVYNAAGGVMTANAGMTVTSVVNP